MTWKISVTWKLYAEEKFLGKELKRIKLTFATNSHNPPTQKNISNSWPKKVPQRMAGGEPRERGEKGKGNKGRLMEEHMIIISDDASRV